MGHYCPAKAFQGMSDVGVCDPCLRNEDCSVIAAIKLRDEDGFVDKPDVAPGQVRVVPRAEWPQDTSIKEQDHDITSVPFGLRKIVTAERYGGSVPTPPHVEEPKAIARESEAIGSDRAFFRKIFASCPRYIDSLTEDQIKALRKAVKYAPRESWFIETRVEDDWIMMLEEPIFYAEREVARDISMELSETVDSRQTRIMIFRNSAAALPKHESNAPQWEKKKPAKEAARKLLLTGLSAAKVAGQVGLSEPTVYVIRREMIADGSLAPDGRNSRPVRAVAAESAPEQDDFDEVNGLPLAVEPKEDVMPESTPLEIAQAAYVDLCSAIMECEALYRAAKMPLPEPLFRFLNEPVRMKELAIVKHNPGPIAPSSTAYPHLLFEGLIGKLPAPGSTWLSKDRIRWMDTVIKIVDLLYEDPEAEDWIYSVSRDSLK